MITPASPVSPARHAPGRSTSVVRQIADRRGKEVTAELGSTTYRELAAAAKRAPSPRPLVGPRAPPGRQKKAHQKPPEPAPR